MANGPTRSRGVLPPALPASALAAAPPSPSTEPALVLLQAAPLAAGTPMDPERRTASLRRSNTIVFILFAQECVTTVVFV